MNNDLSDSPEWLECSLSETTKSQSDLKMKLNSAVGNSEEQLKTLVLHPGLLLIPS